MIAFYIIVIVIAIFIVGGLAVGLWRYGENTMKNIDDPEEDEDDGTR